MIIANAPVVLLGERIAARMPVRLIHAVGAAVFLAVGALVLPGAGAAVE